MCFPSGILNALLNLLEMKEEMHTAYNFPTTREPSSYGAHGTEK